MSYSFRNRPKLSDRYRGKSGDEILNDLKSQFDEDRKMFFESSPGWNSAQSPGSFSRATHHPMDDMMSRGRRDIRSHLDDLAQRHPEFADHLRCPPWGGEMGSPSHDTWGRKRCGSGSSAEDAGAAFSEAQPQDSEQYDEASPSRGRSRQNNLPQYGLRNTVDLGQQQQQQQHQQQESDGDQEKGRGQRSWSAPPDNRTQNPPDSPRYVSRLDIPVNSTSSSNTATPDQGKPPVAPKHNQPSHQPSPPQPQQPQQPQHSSTPKQNQQGSTVRHIPIFVEGRDEPLLPKTAAEVPTEKVFTEKVFSERTVPQSNFNYGRPSQFTSRSQPQQQPQTSRMPQHAAFGQSAATPKTKTSQSPPKQQQASQEQTSKSEGSSQVDGETNSTSHQAKPTANDPICRVQAVQKEVDELKVKVEQYSGNSRKDKGYLYLDEMLTRNLLKLDNIETEGRDDVRQARKAVIRDIQKCISDLESRVPNPEEISSDSVVAKVDEESVLGLTSTPSQTTGDDKDTTPENTGDVKMSEDNVSNDVNSTVQETSVGNTEVTSEEMESEPCVGQNVGAPSEPSPNSLPSDQVTTEATSSGVQEETSSQLDMQVDKQNSVQPSQEAMDVDLSSQNNLPVTTENEIKKNSPPGTTLNIKLSSKVKSPKGSPKKGKRTT